MKIAQSQPLVLILAIGLCGPGFSQQSQQAPSQPPLRELDVGEKRGSAVMVSYPDVHGAVTYSMSDETVRFYWRRDFSDHLPELQTPPQLSVDGLFTSIQEESTSFWPTEVCGFGVNRICVAGKAALGTTRIQVWTLSSSADLGEPYADQNGVIQYPRNVIPIESKATIYDADLAGKRLVRAMFCNHGQPTKLFVQFHDSANLFELDSTTGQLSLVLSATQEPLLQDVLYDRWSAHHALGYMYNIIAPGDDGTLVLFDTNLDGVLDMGATLHLTGEQWYSGAVDFSDTSGYVEIF